MSRLIERLEKAARDANWRAVRYMATGSYESKAADLRDLLQEAANELRGRERVIVCHPRRVGRQHAKQQ